MASIRKRGSSYQITVSNGRRADGSQIIETTTYVPDPARTERQNQKALEKFVIEFEDKVKSGKYLDGEKITFAGFVDKWLAEYAAIQLEETTIDVYKILLKKHITPELGHLKLAKIQPLHINKLCNKLLTERKDGKPGGYSTATVKRVHDLISGILSTAVHWNILLENPCSRVQAPKQTKECNDIHYFTVEQTEAFLGALRHDYDAGHIKMQHVVYFQMAFFAGFRRGELIALTWADINFDAKTVNIHENTVLVAGKAKTKKPKTKSSIRTVSIPDSVVALLKEYRKEQIRYRLSLGSQWIGDNYLFIQWNGRQMYPSTPYNVFKKIIHRYNERTADDSQKLPDIAPHDLRHTSATVLISQNVDIRTVAGRLGHAQTSTTMNIYSHALQKADEKAASVMDDLFNPEKEKNQTLVKC